MNDLLKHYKSLPRLELQRELRRMTGIESLYLWEYVGLGWLWEPIFAGPQTAAKFGVQINDAIGYRVIVGHLMGGAFGDLMNIETQDSPYPDPFK